MKPKLSSSSFSDLSDAHSDDPESAILESGSIENKKQPVSRGTKLLKKSGK